jgi:CRISPR-associated protein Cmr6
MSGYNNSLRYYKTYYEQINWDNPDDPSNAAAFKRQNELLLTARFPTDQEQLLGYPGHLDGFELETTYPGLLIGSGITHGSGLLGEMKLGFFLDYTSGLPVLAGSSVKGVLRSAFPQGYAEAAKKGKKTEEKDLLEKKAESVLNYIAYHLVQITGDETGWTPKRIQALEDFLFGAYGAEKSDVPMSGRVVFHDAYPLNVKRVKLNNRYTQTYLGDDYITPHKNRKRNGIPDALVNPVPISFLKVLPGVLFRFQFELHDFKQNDAVVLGKAQIAHLFQNLLLELGAGAKTNVGYGQFALPSPEPDAQALQRAQAFTNTGSTTPSNAGGSSSFEVGQEVEATILRVNWAENKLELKVDGNRSSIAPMQVAKNLLDNLARQKKIKVWVRALNEDGSIKFLGNNPPKPSA